MEKTCNKCNETKLITDFYKRGATVGGRESRCKKCRSSMQKVTRDKNMKCPILSEEIRAKKRKRYHLGNYNSKRTVTATRKRKYNKTYNSKYPEKVKAHNACLKIKAKIKGDHLHHWSYNEKHYIDIIELPMPAHKKLHRLMTYDQDAKMYRRKDNGELLDTRAKHCAFIFLACDYIVE